jgi:hemolysin III|tara:strand:- start:726 stop:1379 length:654 start_codon:yes stop_codon:yes gene_type:complete
MNLKIKEPFSAISHALGAVFAIVALILLIQESVNPIKPWHIVSFSIFGSGMFLLYTASTLYHWLPVSANLENKLRNLDHAMIHVLIASTYTPVCLIPLRGIWGWSMFGIIWGLAIFGILLKVFWKSLPNWFSITFYIFMGWLSIIAIYPMIMTLQIGAMVWIFIGGFFYTIGAVIHGLNKPNPIPKIFGAHEIFHVFVILGSFSHFMCMYNYITIFD